MQVEDDDSSAENNSKKDWCLFNHEMTKNYVYGTALNKANTTLGCRKERRRKFKCFMESHRKTSHSSGHPCFEGISSDPGNI